MQARARLLAASLDRIRDFETLHADVERRIRPIAGIGPLTVYDTALRIGAKLGIKPNRVYLHAGTTIGARALGLDAVAPSLDPTELPSELRHLELYEVEDFLCIFKSRL
jgi:hypothetical protein